MRLLFPITDWRVALVLSAAACRATSAPLAHFP